MLLSFKMTRNLPQPSAAASLTAGTFIKRPEARNSLVAVSCNFISGFGSVSKMQTMQITFFWLVVFMASAFLGADWYEKAQDAILPSPTHDNMQIPQGDLALNVVG